MKVEGDCECKGEEWARQGKKITHVEDNQAVPIQFELIKTIHSDLELVKCGTTEFLVTD